MDFEKVQNEVGNLRPIDNSGLFFLIYTLWILIQSMDHISYVQKKCFHAHTSKREKKKKFYDQDGQVIIL